VSGDCGNGGYSPASASVCGGPATGTCNSRVCCSPRSKSGFPAAGTKRIWAICQFDYVVRCGQLTACTLDCVDGGYCLAGKRSHRRSATMHRLARTSHSSVVFSELVDELDADGDLTDQILEVTPEARESGIQIERYRSVGVSHLTHSRARPRRLRATGSRSECPLGGFGISGKCCR
jgi:hypothetical protein